MEGEFDALSVVQECGDLVAVVASGTTKGSHTPRWVSLLAQQERVLVAFDAERDKEMQMPSGGPGVWVMPSGCALCGTMPTRCCRMVSTCASGSEPPWQSQQHVWECRSANQSANCTRG